MLKRSLSVMLCMFLVLGLMLAVAPAVKAEGEKHYTLNYSMAASPLNWNPHAWEMSNEADLMDLILAPLVDSTIAEDGVNFTWIYEAADSVTDITADFADKEKWGITADKGVVWEIKLNEFAKWDDGTQINADSYVYSMKTLLDPAMKNYRANNYVQGDAAIVGAFDYFYSDKAGQPKYVAVARDKEDESKLTEPADGKYYFNVDETVLFFDDSVKSYYENEKHKDKFIADGVDLFEKYKEGYAEVTEEVQADILKIAAAFGDENPEAWKEFVVMQDGVYADASFDNVGFFKTGDYSFVIIRSQPTTQFYMNTSLMGSFLVKEDLYEAGKKTVEKLTATSYNTDLASTACSGPYKMVSFEKDKQIVLERNENWFGRHDGRHEGHFAADTIKLDIISEHNTRKQLFLQGKLDTLGLTGEDMATYRMSDYLLVTDLTYTFRFIFATSLESLSSLETEHGDGNKRILHYPEFRKALSLAMDRKRLCNEATSAFKPAYFLFNTLYYYDIENNLESNYRYSTPAKEAVLRLYGIEYGEGKDYADVDEAYAAVTGYDVEEAKELFKAAYEKAVADGNYEEGQKIKIRCMASAASALTADDTKQQDLMNEFAAAATAGTPLEGKINFEFLCGSKTRYADVASGKIEMIRGAWGGAAFYPYQTMGVYVSPKYMGGLASIHESNGWDPTKQDLTIKLDFKGDGNPVEETHNLEEWYDIINNVEHDYSKNVDLRLGILSHLETAVLSNYQCIPWGTDTSCTLRSKKIEFATYDYNIMYGYGGDRLLTFNYSDEEWDAYVKEQGGTLNYE